MAVLVARPARVVAQMSPAIPQGVCLPYGERWQVFRARSGYAAPEHPLMSIWFPHRQVIPSCASKYYVPRTFSIILVL